MEARGGVGQVLTRLEKVLSLDSLDEPPWLSASTAGGIASQEKLAMKATVLALTRQVMCDLVGMLLIAGVS